MALPRHDFGGNGLRPFIQAGPTLQVLVVEDTGDLGGEAVVVGAVVEAGVGFPGKLPIRLSARLARDLTPAVDFIDDTRYTMAELRLGLGI